MLILKGKESGQIVGQYIEPIESINVKNIYSDAQRFLTMTSNGDKVVLLLKGNRIIMSCTLDMRL